MWFPNKVNLNAGNKERYNVTLAKDVSVEGHKNYAVFQTSTQMLEYVKAFRTKSFYEVIPDIQNHETYLFFDIDRDIYIGEHQIDEDDIIDAVMRALTLFMQKVYNKKINFVEGENYHVATATTNKKISAHIKCNIKCPNISVHKNFIQNFGAFISNNASLNNDDTTLLQYEKIENDKVRMKTVFDPSVYKNFQCYRTLYSSKKGKNNALMPHGCSSPNIEDHLVIVHKEIPQDVIYTIYQKDYKPDMKMLISQIQNVVITTSKKKNDSPDKHIPAIPASHLNQVADWITESKEIQRIIGKPFKLTGGTFVDSNRYNFFIDPDCKCKCLYSGHVHKSNRQFFEYRYPQNIINYKCFDVDCIAKWKDEQIVFNIRPMKSYLLNFLSFKTKKTFHCKDEMIEWNEEYNSPEMKPYPVVPICAVKANMGVGKTKEAMNFIETKIKPDAKCLFITYSRTLSRKYLNELSGLGFKNYLDILDETQNNVIYDNKVIICLDSLWKIKQDSFDYIFIDEVLSVLTHFNSPLMEKRALICMIFEMIIMKAKSIYLLDACVDNTLVYNFVEYFKEKKNVPAYWIKNKYIRPTNRKATIQRGNKQISSEDVAKHIIDLYSQGKRCVVASSTKGFTENLNYSLKRLSPENSQIKILVYNSGTDQEIIKKHAENPNIVWNEYDVLIYSPSISAGMSFELPHFHEFIGVFENRQYAPPLDTVLQMIFRVRQLIDGKMTFYIIDANEGSKANYPDTENDVDDFLQKDIMTVSEYFNQTDIPFISDCPSTIVYDKNKRPKLVYDQGRLSYTILSGITLNKGKSINNFTEILKDTLEKEYNIDCVEEENMEGVIETSCVLDNHMDFWEDFIIDQETYINLKNSSRKGIQLTSEQKTQCNVYNIFVERMGIVPQKIDLKLFKRFPEIISVKQHNINKVKEWHYGMKRLEMIFTKTIAENQNDFMKKMVSLTNHKYNKDGNLDMRSTNIRKHYQILLECQSLMNHLGDMKKLRNGEDVEIKEDKVKQCIHQYVEAMSNDQFNILRRNIDLDKKTYDFKEKLEKKPQTFIDKLFSNGCNIKWYFDRGTHNTKRKNYGKDGIYTFSIKNDLDLIAKYGMNIQFFKDDE